MNIIKVCENPDPALAAAALNKCAKPVENPLQHAMKIYKVFENPALVAESADAIFGDADDIDALYPGLDIGAELGKVLTACRALNADRITMSIDLGYRILHALAEKKGCAAARFRKQITH